MVSKHSFPAAWLLALLAALAASEAQGQSRGGAPVYKTRLVPHWFDAGRKLWYRNDLAGGKREFVLVDGPAASRRPAFDHDKLAAGLRAAGAADAAADRLPLDDLHFDLAAHTLHVQIGERWWRCNLADYKVSPAERPATAAPAPRAARSDVPRTRRRTGAETELTFINRTTGDVELFWLDPEGARRSYGTLAPGARRAQHTFAGHVWEAVGPGGRLLGRFQAEETGGTAAIEERRGDPPAGVRAAGDDTPPNRPERSPAAPGRRRRGQNRSPDGRWTAEIKDHNIVLRSHAAGEEKPLTTDGREGQAYERLQWSPDSSRLVAFRVTPGDRHEVHLIESSPPGGGRARLHSREYALPGDRFPRYELRLFDVAAASPVECPADPIDFGTPRLRWGRDGHTFTYEQVDRGHQRLRLVEIDAHSGACRNVIDERSSTFLWTAHTESVNVRRFTWLEKSDEIIYASERDGWRHLYLVDVRTGAIKNAITRGEFVVRGIERIDEDRRQIVFQASGRNPGEDPYFLHTYRVNFDGSGLVALTAGNGTHTIQWPADGEYLIDTWSRVDHPPVHELRRASDGALVCPLETADISELVASGWEPPEVFAAKGRDGTTDIWGIVCRPRDFDPAKKYPVIEQIYAGPQSAYVPKAFSPQRRFASLTDLGFVVVQIDGMGTANRSKAFHDVCWQNLKDAGLPDRILWHRALAAKYPWYDITRVGIYGTSAGGQNAAGALLFHPDFYKVGVAACGCHDNRMDKASWNEQWMGYPVGPHYAASSNIEHAGRLEGKLLLIVGELDRNVPPESTLRFADALIKAGKDFDLLVIPGGGHGMGGAYGMRRMHDFFVRHLLGREPPDRNRP